MALEIIDVSDQARELRECTDWLQSIGAVVDGARLGMYLRTLSDIAERCVDGKHPRVRELVNDRATVCTIFEIVELMSTYRALRKIDDAELHRRLAQFASGPANYAREKVTASSNDARDLSRE